MEPGSYDYIVTQFSGKFYIPVPKPENFRIEDIANALAMLPRFGGHLPWHYSVAQHCVLGASQLPQEFKLEFLLHDRAEAYLVDLPRPIKHMLPDYMVIEANITEVSAPIFHVPVKMSPEVKEADRRMLVTEAARFFPRAKDRWWEEPQWPAPYSSLRIQQWSPRQASSAFLTMYKTLA